MTRLARDPNTAELARRLLESVAEGRRSAEVAEALADAVLSVEPVCLARQVLAGGPHALDRAIELAALVLPDAADAAERETGS